MRLRSETTFYHFNYYNEVLNLKHFTAVLATLSIMGFTPHVLVLFGLTGIILEIYKYIVLKICIFS